MKIGIRMEIALLKVDIFFIRCAAFCWRKAAECSDMASASLNRAIQRIKDQV